MSQHVFITGGARGIGAAMVRAFSAAGYSVSFTYLSSHDRAAALARETGALALCADGCDEGAVAAAVRTATDKNGPVYALLNCAGISSFQLFQDVSTELWEQTVNTNLRAAFFYIRALLPEMIAAKSGVILNISSVWGMVGASCEVLYSTTKAALIGMTKALAKELGPSGVRVNCVAPGVIGTDMNGHLSERDREQLAEDTALCRLGKPEEVAQAIAFLASEDAAFITGQVLEVDGGIIA